MKTTNNQNSFFFVQINLQDNIKRLINIYLSESSQNFEIPFESVISLHFKATRVSLSDDRNLFHLLYAKEAQESLEELHCESFVSIDFYDSFP